MLRRLAFIRAARNVGLTLEEIRVELDQLPARRAPRPRPTGSGSRRTGSGRLDEQIEALQALRDGLASCIGCGCLSLRQCAISNPADVAVDRVPGGGAVFLPPLLRREPAEALSGAGA